MSDDAGETYDGLLGAFRYARRAGDSRLFRSYVLVGGLVSLFVALVFLNGLVTLVADTTGTSGGTFTLSRAFFVVVSLFTVGPLLAPVLVGARRLRRGVTFPAPTQAVVGATGYVYLFALYAGVAVTAPDEYEPAATGVLAPVIDAMNAAPDIWGLALPAAAAVGMLVTFRVVR